MSSFRVYLTSAAERSCKKLPPHARDFVFKKLPGILAVNPLAGEALVLPLKPLRSFHFSSDGQPYRAVYGIEVSLKKIVIHFVGHRRRFYERIRNIFPL